MGELKVYLINSGGLRHSFATAVYPASSTVAQGSHAGMKHTHARRLIYEGTKPGWLTPAFVAH